MHTLALSTPCGGQRLWAPFVHIQLQFFPGPPPLPFPYPWATPALLINSPGKDGRDLEGWEECHERRNPHTLGALWEVSPTLNLTLTTHLPLTVRLQAGHFQKGKPYTPSGHHVRREAQASGDKRHRTGRLQPPPRRRSSHPSELPSGAMWSHPAPTPPPNLQSHQRSRGHSWVGEQALPGGLRGDHLHLSP